MHVIATAGHVDHGKSTLVRLLTGMEPDRWEEERRRGLTIDLGFGWTTLPTGETVAIVDVPGHERFVPHMLAGVGPAPAVLFVVAADEGWMPQSEEHLAALDALGVRHGLLAVTRSDLADPAPAEREALARIAGTSLGRIGSVAVSGRTGDGLGPLRAGLSRLLAELPATDPEADVRLWLDRSFSIAGAGTVVTGTLTGGTLRAGDELEAASTGTAVRVRGLQMLGREVSTAGPVARVAVNLRGAGRDTPVRGDALLSPGRWLTTEEIDVALHGGALDGPADSRDLPPGPVLHIGSAAVAARLRPLAGRTARLRLSRPLPLRFGDRVLLRDPGRHRIATGALVLDIRPPRLRRRGAARSHGAELAALAGPVPDPARAADAVLRRERLITAAELRARGLPPSGEAVGEGWLVHPFAWTELQEELRAVLGRWQDDHPLDPGVPVEAVRKRLRLPALRVTERLAADTGLAVVAGRVCAAGRTPALPARVEAAVAELTAELSRNPFAAPDADRLARLRLGPKELAAAVRAGRLSKVGDGVFLLPGATERAAVRLAGLPQPFTLSLARQALGTTRRVAVPLMELLHRDGISERTADGTHRMRSAGPDRTVTEGDRR
ncbi:SelB C-terminal domain-containing protein [Streptomyces sp. ACA25]|uniref:selenocysteine-specific translation elongation factor n=1 Tax=Streptomyces sp. ACA25 TaxID=3022596 RepID=UPI002307D097|nr:SelB C-terminal domain-containing protein [Streptomyces sp. ACA25]MDB1090048.1 SelB C-terminal domain-containing protein [Streptomyces sp. ACA25]